MNISRKKEGRNKELEKWMDILKVVRGLIADKMKIKSHKTAELKESYPTKKDRSDPRAVDLMKEIAALDIAIKHLRES